MKNLALVALFSGIIVFTSCTDDAPSYTLNPPADLTLPSADTTTVPTIDVTNDDTTYQDTTEDTHPDVQISVSGEGIDIASPAYSINRNTDVNDLHVKFDEQGNIQYLEVNKTILYSEKSTYRINHNYVFMEDNCLVIQPNNVLDAIITDFNAQGYKLSRASLKTCNPYLNKRSIRTDDILCLSCAPNAKGRKN